MRSYCLAAAKSLGCDVTYFVLPMLSALGAAIGNSRRIRLKRKWLAPPILWTVIIGESGTMKTPAFSLVLEPLHERERKLIELNQRAAEKYNLDLAHYEKEYAVWKKDKRGGGDPPTKPEPPRIERMIVSDTTVEALAPILLQNPRGLLLARDELAGWFAFDRYSKGKAGSDAPNWLSMYHTQPIKVDRRTGVPPMIYVPRAAVCITGGIQPGILDRVLAAEHRESGLAARLLVAHPPRRAKKWNDAEIDQRIEAEYVAVVERLYAIEPGVGDDGHPQPIALLLTKAAAKLWHDFYDVHNDEALELSGEMASAYSKLEEVAPRLALIVHCIRAVTNDGTLESADRIDEASMAAAIAMTTWFKAESRRVYGMLAETDDERNLRRLVEWVERRSGRVSVREVVAGCRWLLDAVAAESALNELVEAQRGQWTKVPTTDKGGRPSRVFTLLSACQQSAEPVNCREIDSCADADSADDPNSHTAADGWGEV